MRRRPVGILFGLALLVAATIAVGGAPSASAASPAALSIGDTTVVESGTTRVARLPVTLSDPQPTDVVVTYTVAAGTATPGDDYLPKTSGKLTFRAGVVARSVSIKVLADNDVESTETVVVTLQSATPGLDVTRATGSLSIVDDDPPGAGAQWSMGDVTVVEGDTGPLGVVKVPVRLSRPILTDSTITYTTTSLTATPRRDYVAMDTKQVRVPALKTAFDIPVKVVPDSNAEGEETITITLSSPSAGSIARAVGTVAILDTDPPGPPLDYGGGALHATGWNAAGTLGDGTIVSRTSFAASGSDADWYAVSAGASHSCGIRSNGSLWCWGSNVTGQVGDGTGFSRTSPVRVGTDTDWITLKAGDHHTCAIRTDGTLWCWGDNEYGQLGDGTGIDRHQPVQVGTDTDWASISAGEVTTCGIRTDGSLWCWGNSDGGQLGAGSARVEYRPLRIGKDRNWASVSNGTAYICGLRTDGTLWCWGYNGSGALGDGTTISHFKPAQVGSGTWRSVSTGAETTCAVATEGTLWCWGWNEEGEVGDGTTTHRLAPVQVGIETDWLTMSLLDIHACGIRAGGTLWCWGYNGSGGLGDGTTENRSAPVQVGIGTAWRAVSAGAAHTLAIPD